MSTLRRLKLVGCDNYTYGKVTYKAGNQTYLISDASLAEFLLSRRDAVTGLKYFDDITGKATVKPAPIVEEDTSDVDDSAFEEEVVEDVVEEDVTVPATESAPDVTEDDLHPDSDPAVTVVSDDGSPLGTDEVSLGDVGATVEV